MSRPVLLWFRQDFRLTDNPALQAALARGAPVIPVYCHAPDEEGDWAPGGAARWWQHHSLAALDASLRARGSRLILRQTHARGTGTHGATLQELERLIEETGADAVFWNRRYEPAIVARDSAIKAALRERGVLAESHNAALFIEPWQVQNQSGKPFQVFTPYWRHIMKTLAPAPPSPAPTTFARDAQPARWPPSESLAGLGLLPRIPWYAGMASAWQPGETGAAARLEEFTDGAIAQYRDGRERPATPGTSRLSPHLHHGEISPRQIWHAVARRAAQDGHPPAEWRASQFVTELGWREFAHHLLFHFPHTPQQPLRAEFERFPWRSDAAQLAAWQRGRTGIPLVDAGMRELWHTGWMHNRVRMVVASFLVKNLRLPWQAGARWFWDTLVDADLAANTLGWQWSAGCGADAAPYFRIFNPVSQGERFDVEGEYVRRWVPELAQLPAKFVHAPWTADATTLRNAGVTLGVHYPQAIVDLKASRATALEAYQSMRAVGRDG